jgi:hypothetical protein
MIEKMKKGKSEEGTRGQAKSLKKYLRTLEHRMHHL